MTHEIFDVVRAGNTDRLRALLAADRSLATIRDERGNTPVLLAQYHDKRDAVAVLLDARPALDIFDAASVGQSMRVAEWLDKDPALLNAPSSMGFSPIALAAAPLAAMKGHIGVLQLLKGSPSVSPP